MVQVEPEHVMKTFRHGCADRDQKLKESAARRQLEITCAREIKKISVLDLWAANPVACIPCDG